jgi:ectoine hydroxylase-related dioxygenase (phytanoyl-CoA dioxygenase family)
MDEKTNHRVKSTERARKNIAKGVLTSKQLEEFESNGFIVIPGLIKEQTVHEIKEAMDELQAGASFNKNGRWDLRNCLPRHPNFVDLLADTRILTAATQLLDWNIKLLASQVVKMSPVNGDELPVNWHRDGGILSAELPDPLPKLFIKVAVCISCAAEAEGGELLVVPGSHRMVGEPAVDQTTNFPFGASKVLVKPGDVLLFDWRLWHAVNKNSSTVVRRTLYLTFGYRWLAPIDHQEMPEQLRQISPIHRQLLGGATDLGNYLPTETEVPLKKLIEKVNGGEGNGL